MPETFESNRVFFYNTSNNFKASNEYNTTNVFKATNDFKAFTNLNMIFVEKWCSISQVQLIGHTDS